ncbi:MAG TPA: GAF domain-containing protein [Jatrophihabitantaceae bacterium]|jgi:signal transduction histidine kinase
MSSRDARVPSVEPPDQGPTDYPDVPRLELDQLLGQLIDRAQDVVGTQDRLRGLLRANRSIVGDLALPVVLQRIVEAARELAHARYAALGVVAPDSGLEQFIHVGFDDETVTDIGHLPEGKGLLGALIDDPRPIKLGNIADDRRSVGFPSQHPPMASFLGVPIRIRNEVYGNLYLTEREGGEFTAEDEDLVSALAATAATAIENARLFGESRRRQDWLQASAEITRQLLSGEGEQALQLIARRVGELANADVVTVVLPSLDQQSLVVDVAVGEGAEQLAGTSYPLAGTLSALAISTGRPVMIGDVQQDTSYTVHLSEVVTVGPVMAIPLVGALGNRGALVTGRLHGQRQFNDVELDMAMTFANHASVALELADARADQQRVALLEDRDRIARDLHDHVIQRLFAAGLSVQTAASSLRNDQRGDRLGQVVDDIDETIRQIRTSIFELRGPLGPARETVRTRVLAVVDDLADALGFSPDVRFAGPLDTMVDDDVADDVVAVVREALSNVARHAQAQRVEIEITATGQKLTIDIIDDGRGLGDTSRRSGLANLQERAERRGGTLSVPEHDGARLIWSVPLS